MLKMVVASMSLMARGFVSGHSDSPLKFCPIEPNGSSPACADTEFYVKDVLM